MSKLTSVEWLFNYMKQMQYFIGNDLLEAFEQAKEMHKQEIKIAREDMQKKCISIANKITPNLFEFDKNESDKYYNETFKTDKQ